MEGVSRSTATPTDEPEPRKSMVPGTFFGLALLLDASLVLIMRSDPNPNEICPVLNGQRPVMRANPHGPQLANLFEVQ